jgi:hypothetical protein
VARVVTVNHGARGKVNPNFQLIGPERTLEVAEGHRFICFNNGNGPAPAFVAFLREQFPAPVPF